MTREEFLGAYNIGHRDGKEGDYLPNDYDDIFHIEEPKTDRIEYGTDGNPYRLSISNGKEYEQERCKDCLFRREWEKIGKLISAILEKQTEQEPKTDILDKIRAEIEPKCDRINSIASILPYTAHREIQELLCEIMDLYKAEIEPQESEEVNGR